MTQAAGTLAEGVKGIEVMAAREQKQQRAAVLFLTIAPLAGFAGAVASLWGHGLSTADIAIFALLYLWTGLGVTVGFHRLLTHKSFDAPRPVRILFAVAGSMSIEGSVISWVANHRRHHAYADKEGDPHSPHLEDGEGLGAVMQGLWHAHIGWLFNEEKTTIERWAPDLLKDPAMRRVDRLFPLLSLVSLALPAVIGFAVTRTWWGGLTAFLWGGLARAFLLHHVTWSVNSICHFFGRRPFETSDFSTNNWPLSLLSLGESWHNNHHAFPTSPVHGIGRFQFDLSGLLIKALEKLNLAYNLKRVGKDQLARKRAHVS